MGGTTPYMGKPNGIESEYDAAFSGQGTTGPPASFERGYLAEERWPYGPRVSPVGCWI